MRCKINNFLLVNCFVIRNKFRYLPCQSQTTWTRYTDRMSGKMKTLSDNAKKLYEAIKLNGGWMHEDNAIEVLFKKPIYPTKEEENREEKQRVYWKWDISLYGGEKSYPVGNGFETFSCPFSESFDRVVYSAWQEIKKSGLGYSKNNGYNSYTYFIK